MQTASMLCERCGKDISANARFCPKCGFSIVPSGAPSIKHQENAPASKGNRFWTNAWVTALATVVAAIIGAWATVFKPAPFQPIIQQVVNIFGPGTSTVSPQATPSSKGVPSVQASPVTEAVAPSGDLKSVVQRLQTIDVRIDLPTDLQKIFEAAGNDVNKVGATTPNGYTITAWEAWGGGLPFSIRQFDPDTGKFVSEIEQHSQRQPTISEYHGQVSGNTITLAGEIEGPYPATSVCVVTLDVRDKGNLAGFASCHGSNGVSIRRFTASAKIY
jgi:hypothetical protein